MEILEKIWWIEHQIRNMTGRGMRPGRAIKRLFPDLSSGQVKSLAEAWQGKEFGLTIGESQTEFVAGYTYISSCMQGKGELCHAAYTPHGVRIAILWRDGVPVARSLIWENGYVRTYGSAHYQLEAVLTLAGLEWASLRHMWGKIAVVERVKVLVRNVHLPELRRSVGYPTNFTFAENESRAKYYPTGSYEVVRPATIVQVYRDETRMVFAPYLD